MDGGGAIGTGVIGNFDGADTGIDGMEGIGIGNGGIPRGLAVGKGGIKGRFRVYENLIL